MADQNNVEKNLPSGRENERGCETKDQLFMGINTRWSKSV